MFPALRRLRGRLRSRRLIVAEALALAALGALGAAIPQAAKVSAQQMQRFGEGYPLVASVTGALGLQHIFSSPLFLTVVALATASLVTVTIDQWRHFLRTWKRPLGELYFVKASYRVEFERPAAGTASSSPRQEIRSRGRLGELGSPLFHLGLLAVIVAALARTLFGADAVVDLIEGETLAPEPSAWAAQWPGPLARPFSLAVPLRFDELMAERYTSGGLERLAARIELEGMGSSSPTEVGVNTPLRLGARSLYLAALHGPAALLEVGSEAGSVRSALLLEQLSDGTIRGVGEVGTGLEARLRAKIPVGSVGLPTTFEVRLLEWGSLAYSGVLRIGEVVEWAPGSSLILHDVRYWARFSGSRDHATWLAYGGFSMLVLGAVLIFSMVRVDTAVIVTPEGDRERVVVALRAARFAPLFAERFQEMVEREGGPEVTA